jgi:hypothetical protein
MPTKLLPCILLPPATILSVPIYDYVIANEELAKVGMEEYDECCGKSVCKGCIYSFVESGNKETCPFCKAEIMSKTNEERVEEIMKWVEANDAGAIIYWVVIIRPWKIRIVSRSGKSNGIMETGAELGSNDAHYHSDICYGEGGGFEESQVPRSCSYGWERKRKIQHWNHGV